MDYKKTIIEGDCPNCLTTLQIEESDGRKNTTCPNCGEKFKINELKDLRKETKEFDYKPSSNHSKNNKGNIPIIIVIIVLIVTCLVSASVVWTLLLAGTESTSTISGNNSNNACNQAEFDYLRKSGCTLYDNYKTRLSNLNSICDTDYSCRGSAQQKQSQDTLKSWGSFYTLYCSDPNQQMYCTKEGLDYLKKDSCSLYDNYKSLYLAWDTLCNSYAECRGSALQKEGYDTYKTWDSFRDHYCL